MTIKYPKFTIVILWLMMAMQGIGFVLTDLTSVQDLTKGSMITLILATLACYFMALEALFTKAE